MAILKANATYTRTFLAVYKTDHLTGATGVTVIVRLSKAGAAYVATTNTSSIVGNGLYSIALTAADTNTLGDLAFNCSGTNIDNTDFIDQVVNFDFNIPVVTTGTNVDKSNYTLAGGTYSVNLSGSVNNIIQATTTVITGGTISGVSGSVGSVIASVNIASGVNVTQWAGGTANALIAGRVDSNAQVVGDKTGYSLASGTQNGVIIPTVVSVNSVSGSVGSVTGAVGSVIGSVGSVLGSVTTGTNKDKTGYSLLAGQLFVKKNTALNNFMFLMLDSADHVTPKTGLTIVSQVSIDGAIFGNTANTATEVGSGIYTINLANTDTNGTNLMFKFTATGADNRYMEIVTQL